MKFNPDGMANLRPKTCLSQNNLQGAASNVCWGWLTPLPQISPLNLFDLTCLCRNVGVLNALAIGLARQQRVEFGNDVYSGPGRKLKYVLHSFVAP